MHLVHVAARLLALGGESLDAPLCDAVLVQGGLQLALHVVIVRLQLRQLPESDRWEGLSRCPDEDVCDVHCNERHLLVNSVMCF